MRFPAAALRPEPGAKELFAPARRSSAAGLNLFIPGTNPQNNLLTSTDPNGGVTSYAYDPLGEATSLTDPDGNTTNWSYDHLGNRTTASQAVVLGYFLDGTVNTTTATSYGFYDANGNQTTSTDADGRAIATAFDHLNEETGETWYNGAASETGTVAYSYDDNGETLTADNATVSGETTSPVANYTFSYDVGGHASNIEAELGKRDEHRRAGRVDDAH